MSEQIRTERVFPLINGGELIETEERILFSRSSPGATPILTEPNVEMDKVLDTLYWTQEDNRKLWENQQKLIEGLQEIATNRHGYENVETMQEIASDYLKELGIEL